MNQHNFSFASIRQIAIFDKKTIHVKMRKIWDGGQFIYHILSAKFAGKNSPDLETIERNLQPEIDSKIHIIWLGENLEFRISQAKDDWAIAKLVRPAAAAVMREDDEE